MHEWRNDEFFVGEWEGYTTCLQRYTCKRCDKTKTLPVGAKLIDNTECVAKLDFTKLEGGKHAVQGLQNIRSKTNGAKKNERRNRLPKKNNRKRFRSSQHVRSGRLTGMFQF